MKPTTSFPMILASVALLAGAAALPATAAEPEWVRGRPQTRGVNSTGVQYFLESAVVAGKSEFVRLIVIQDRPEFEEYHRAQLDDAASTTLRLVMLERQPIVGSSGVREVFAVYLSDEILRGVERRLSLVIDGPSETLKIGVSGSYIKNFLKQLGAAVS